MPKVSIILSSYNHAKFIRESIENTLKQSFSDFELIIWDDGSSDNSWELIKQYSDPRIKAYRNEKNIGGVFGVNKAISEIAKGEYIAIHHSDDVWELDKLQKQVEFLAANQGVGAVFTNTKPVNERGLPLADQSHFYYNIFNQPNRSRHEWLRRFFFGGNALCHPSILIRKQCYEDCGLYLDSLAQLTDFDMWVRLCLKYEIHVLPERLVRFRVRDGEMNASGNRPEVRMRDRSEFHHILKHYLRINSFEELVAIFPEAEQYRRADGCIPQFVFAMMALGDDALPWAKMLGIETLFDLMADAETKEKIKTLYQFNYRDFIALTGKFDLFNIETIIMQNAEIAARDEVIKQMAGQIEQLGRAGRASGMVEQPVAGGTELPEDRKAYEQAARLLESGSSAEGKARLEGLAASGSTCWDVYNDLAVQYFNEGDYARAVPLFEKGMALEGRAGTTARNFASMFLAAGDVEAALAVWGRILREQPHDDAVLTVICDVLSHINPIPATVWQQLVADLRGGQQAVDASVAGGAGNGVIEKTVARTSGTPAKEIKIFQIFYDEQTRLKLDPNFIPLDNSENARPDWCEYWPIRKVLSSQSFDDDTYLGFFSPRFSDKTGMDGKQVLERVRNSDDEVISFSPFFDLGAVQLNPFVQGEVNHPGLSDAVRGVLALLDVELDPDRLVCDQTTTIFSNYFVARYSFWKRWFAYVEKIIEVCEGPASDLKSCLVSTTPYRKGGEYEMKLFVLERLVTVVMEELGIRSKIGIDIGKAPLFWPDSKTNLIGLLVCDALKGQYRRTGQTVYKDAFLKMRGGPVK